MNFYYRTLLDVLLSQNNKQILEVPNPANEYIINKSKLLLFLPDPNILAWLFQSYRLVIKLFDI